MCRTRTRGLASQNPNGVWSVLVLAGIAAARLRARDSTGSWLSATTGLLAHAAIKTRSQSALHLRTASEQTSSTTAAAIASVTDTDAEACNGPACCSCGCHHRATSAATTLSRRCSRLTHKCELATAIASPCAIRTLADAAPPRKAAHAYAHANNVATTASAASTCVSSSGRNSCGQVELVWLCHHHNRAFVTSRAAPKTAATLPTAISFDKRRVVSSKSLKIVDESRRRVEVIDFCAFAIAIES